MSSKIVIEIREDNDFSSDTLDKIVLRWRAEYDDSSTDIEIEAANMLFYELLSHYDGLRVESRDSDGKE